MKEHSPTSLTKLLEMEMMDDGKPEPGCKTPNPVPRFNYVLIAMVVHAMRRSERIRVIYLICLLLFHL